MPLSDLNLKQREACLAPSGYNLVIASAGTGKTSTIVGRISSLLNLGINPKDILLLTFTNKAAKEMLTRLEKKFDSSLVKNIEAGTFHAVAYRYLRENTLINLKQPSELKALFRSIYDTKDILRNSKDAYKASYLYDLYSLFYNSSISGDFGEWVSRKNEEQLYFTSLYKEVWEEFCKLKQDYNYVDYNDLLLMYRNLVVQNNVRYSEILVDEYQDTNPLQDSILQAFKPESLFCVGDYDQSIYAFNGADISIIAGFKDRYKNSNIFTLSDNYRSTKSILNLANKVIEKNPRIYPKKLEVVKQEDYGEPKLYEYEDTFSQYQGVANKIKLSNIPYENIAVIFRNNSSGDGLEAVFRENGIPIKRKGGLSFFDSKEIKYILNLCTILSNPKDMMAFIHTLGYARGIGDSVAKEIYEALLLLGDGDIIEGMLNPKDDIPNPYQKKGQTILHSLFEEEKRVAFVNLRDDFKEHKILNNPRIEQDGAEFLNSLFAFLKELKNVQKPYTLISKIYIMPIFTIVAQKLAKDRAINKNGKFDKEKYELSLERIERKVSLLLGLAEQHSVLERFLNAMLLGSSEMSEGSGVNLLSIHASKGLEFSCVYIVDLMEGRFPNKKLIGRGGNLEEERRLFYVAVTRAKDILHLSYAKQDSIRNVKYEPSIFLYEGELLEN